MQSSLYGLAENSTEAIDAVRANMSPRARELETLENYATGKQYEGLPDWFSDDVPLWERAPCIVYNITGVAIRSNTHLVLGEGRFPVITSNPGENDAEAGGLDEETSKKVDRAIAELHKRARFRTVCRQALLHAQQAKSCAVIAGTRAGRPFLEIVRSRWCEPTFDIHRNVESIEIRYAYLKWEKQRDGKWRVTALLYRRVIDATSDTTYLPIEADKNGREPEPGDWTPDKALTVKHDLGFCPVHWYAHMRECSTVVDYDGEAIHQEYLDEIRGLDFALSQRHRSALTCGDPQITECGVEPGHNPSGRSVKAGAVPSTYAGGAPSDSNPVTGAYQDSGSNRSARVKSPGAVWQYEDANTKVAYLLLPAEALGALDAHASDLRNKLAEMLCVVILDPQNVKNTADMSGKAIEQLRARQFDRCDEIREDVEENLLLPVSKLLLRVALATKVKIKAVVAVRKELQQFVEDDSGELMLFTRWPSGYIKPDPTEEQAIVKVAVDAKQAGIATTRMAIEKVASIFGVDNVDQACDAIEEEKQKSAANQSAPSAISGGDTAAVAPGEQGSETVQASGANGGPSGSGGGAVGATPTATPKGAPLKAARPQLAKPVAAIAAPDPATISQAGTSTAGVAETVYKQLLEDFQPKSVEWVRAAKWDGPLEIPLDQADLSGRDSWTASEDPERVAFFVERIQAGNRKPVILVNEPNNNKLIVVDGHHRVLAYEQLGMPIYAFVGTVGTVSGPWDEMHGAQRSTNIQKSQQTPSPKAA